MEDSTSTNKTFDREYNIALQRVMALVGSKNKEAITMYVSDSEELQSVMMLACCNYNIKFERTDKEQSYVS